MNVVIVGASIAGLSVAQELRRRGFAEGITMVGAERHPPYDRPPLSKAYLAEQPPADPPWLLDGAAVSDLDLDLRLSTAAAALDPAARELKLADGEPLGYRHLVIATGARARRLPLGHGMAGFSVLRTLDDAVQLRAELSRRPRVAILGAGFIGAEVAAAARSRDLEVTMIDVAPAPMARVLGTRVGTLLSRMHQDHGVHVRFGTTVQTVRGGDRVEQLVLTDGSVVHADLVIEGLGAQPVTEWLDGSGLDTSDGVVCDADLRAAGHDGIFAAGDVASRLHPLLGHRARIEHWSNAVEHGAVVAAAILGTRSPEAAVPYVWSDQYGHRLQIVGRPRADDTVTVVEGPEQRLQYAVYENDGVVTGMLAVDAPKAMMRGRRAVADRLSADELLSRL
jgi:NADPH-dependent 2,4-dienoyl-CoA reductase/sulfur reductase-like enzyme